MIGKTLETCLKLFEADLGTGISRNRHLIEGDYEPSQVNNYISFLMGVGNLQIEFLKKYSNQLFFSGLGLFEAQFYVLSKDANEIDPSAKIIRGKKESYGTKEDVLSSIPTYSLNHSVKLENILTRSVFDAFNSASLALDVGLDSSELLENRENALQFATGVYTRFLEFSSSQEETDVANRHQALKKRSQGYISLGEILGEESFKERAREDIKKLEKLESQHSDLLYSGYFSNGKILLANKDYTLASWAFYQALEIDARTNGNPSSKNVLDCNFNLALIQLEKGNYLNSRNLLEQERKSSNGLSTHSSLIYIGSYAQDANERKGLGENSNEDLELGFEALEYSLPYMKKLISNCLTGEETTEVMLIPDISKCVKNSLDLVYSSLIGQGKSREDSINILRRKFGNEHSSWYFGNFQAPTQHTKLVSILTKGNMDAFPWSKK